MEFKVGDRVRYIGMIHDSFLKNKLGEVKETNNCIYNLVRFYLGNDDTIDMYMADRDLELIEENKKITLEQLEQRIEKLEEQMKDCIKYSQLTPVPEEELKLGGYHTIKGTPDIKLCGTNEETKPSLLTEDERVILRNLDKRYKWIIRDSDNNLYICINEPFKKENMFWNCKGGFDNLGLFNHLFDFIKWEYKEQKPYNIEELLKGESGNEKND